MEGFGFNCEFNPCFNSYVDTANALEKEGGVALTKYEVCDNIDLPTVLQVCFTLFYKIVTFKQTL